MIASAVNHIPDGVPALVLIDKTGDLLGAVPHESQIQHSKVCG